MHFVLVHELNSDEVRRVLIKLVSQDERSLLQQIRIFVGHSTPPCCAFAAPHPFAFRSSPFFRSR